MTNQRHLNGPQTTGRQYRNLSSPLFGITHDNNARVPMRDGATLLADIHRTDADGKYPALIAASPYPVRCRISALLLDSSKRAPPFSGCPVGASTSFITPILSMMGLTSDRSYTFWRRNPLIALARKVLNMPRLHLKFATMMAKRQ